MNHKFLGEEISVCTLIGTYQVSYIQLKDKIYSD